ADAPGYFTSGDERIRITAAYGRGSQFTWSENRGLFAPKKYRDLRPVSERGQRMVDDFMSSAHAAREVAQPRQMYSHPRIELTIANKFEAPGRMAYELDGSMGKLGTQLEDLARYARTHGEHFRDGWHPAKRFALYGAAGLAVAGVAALVVS